MLKWASVWSEYFLHTIRFRLVVRATLGGLCYIRVHIRGSRPDPIQDESRLSRILGPDPHPCPSRRFPCPDNLTLISDSGSAVLQTSVDPVPNPLSGLVTFGVRSHFSTPHLYLSPASWGLIPQFEYRISPESLVLVRLRPKLRPSEILRHIVM
jgi:hypothetical protein